MTYWRNVEAYWRRVDSMDLDAGKQAYPAYWEMMQRIGKHYNVSPVRCAEAFAALSPNNDYFGNLRSLVSVLDGLTHGRGYTISTYKACGNRALTYLTGEVDFMTTVKGKKIRAFRNCIVQPHTAQDFVLDGHMIAIALGQPGMTMAEANLVLRRHGYETLAAAYARFAKRKSMRVPELQATLWHCRKRVHGIKFSSQLDLFYDANRLLYPMTDIRPYHHFGT